jgi:amidase
MTIDAMQQKLQSGELNSLEITQLYIDRIRQFDRKGPSLHSVIKINPDALSIAIRMDAERKQNHIRGPLHGIPVLIKDNINTSDQMPTTAGSLAMIDNHPDQDAFIIQKLRNAGAIILGKTNLSEWANFRSPNGISGWSSVGGQTKNPYVFDQTPCGSSSGSAVAVAADFCMVAVGTETDGSIACPSSFNAVVGIKPTVGLVSRSGIIPISRSQDSAGPMARTVRDAAILLGVMAGYDPNDETTLRCVERGVIDYTQYLHPDGLKGKRIGVEKTMRYQNDPVGVLLEQAIALMEKQGATIIDVEFASLYDEVADEEFEVLKTEFKDGLNQYLASTHGPMHSINDIITFNIEHDSSVMPLFEQETMVESSAKGGLDHPEYLQALSKTYALKSQLDELLHTYHLDALCGVGSGAYSPAAVAGFPSITIPMGTANELPYGITFFGRPFDEPGLLTIGYAYEQTSGRRSPPKYLSTNKSAF